MTLFAEEPLSPLCRDGYAEVNPCGRALRTRVGRKNHHKTKQRSGATGVGPSARRCNPGSLDPTNAGRAPKPHWRRRAKQPVQGQQEDAGQRMTPGGHVRGIDLALFSQ